MIIQLYIQKSEKNYTTSEKEFYAILKALNHFRKLIVSTEISIKTDHANNIYNKQLTHRQQRVKLLLQEFDFKITHVNREDNILADILSRNLNKINDKNNIKNMITVRTVKNLKSL
ncbi:Retrovirus-related Pol polyprotein from transposon [Dictyocoela muelleri]|nr:Retrovirus-related Pol polyprotein from transposon [Dictyocoela muelleri]